MWKPEHRATADRRGFAEIIRRASVRAGARIWAVEQPPRSGQALAT